MEQQRSVSSLTEEGGGDDSEGREYRVRPSYAYPHRWMTRSELAEEMELPSGVVHDLRLKPQEATRRELGLLRVEVLQCLGLPANGGNDPNAIIYLACGSFAFATDVISSCKNPMWLSGAKRACLMPVYHGYARLFAGVFHDSKSSSKDTFIGRVVVELARLRTGCTYDAVLPLRLSTGVYSRRKLGAVRLRLTLVKSDTKEIILSYLPNKRNQTTTTVACGDPKSFRAIALTVHGKHLPGKFSTEALMATVRELTFVQKSIMRIVTEYVKDLMAWRYPYKSCFAFAGWMHCVRSSSATLVPVYVIGMVVLQLAGNYARSITGEKEFQPLRLGEILSALRGASSSTENLRQGRVSVFRALGMLNNAEFHADGVDTYTHKEFPFSSLAGYPRFHVEEATQPGTTGKTDLTDADEEDEADADGDAGDADAKADLKRYISESDQEAYAPRLHFKSPLPEQNIDKKNPKSDKTLTQELEAVNAKAHKYTMKLFADNHPYVITDTATPPWGKRQQKSDKDGDEYDVKRDLDKLLGLGLYAQWNPIVSKFTVQVEPLVGVAEVALCAYRSIYNMFTWRDPFLSFWVLVSCILTIVALILFPWRPIFFVAGLVGLGPQNWFIRLFQEFRGSCGNVRPGCFLRALKELVRPNVVHGDNATKKQLGRSKIKNEPQPIFCNKANIQGKAIGAQHICVPYTPLYYHRFYDWPPDPNHARVLKQMPLDSSTLFANSYGIVTISDQSKTSLRESKNEATSIQNTEKTVEETSSAPSAITLPATEILAPSDSDELALTQQQTSATVLKPPMTGSKGKTWLKKAINKGGQMKEKLEKKMQEEEGGIDEDAAGATAESSGGLSMGRRATIKNEATSIQNTEKTVEEMSSAPSAITLPATEILAPPDSDELALTQQQTSAAVMTGSKGKTWLKKAINKGGQMKEKLEKKISEEEGEIDEDAAEAMTESSGGLSMGRRATINWLAKRKRIGSSDSSPADDTEQEFSNPDSAKSGDAALEAPGAGMGTSQLCSPEEEIDMIASMLDLKNPQTGDYPKHWDEPGLQSHTKEAIEAIFFQEMRPEILKNGLVRFAGQKRELLLFTNGFLFSSIGWDKYARFEIRDYFNNMGKTMKEAGLDEILAKYDSHNDGTLSKNGFMEMLDELLMHPKPNPGAKEISWRSLGDKLKKNLESIDVPRTLFAAFQLKDIDMIEPIGGETTSPNSERPTLLLHINAQEDPLMLTFMHQNDVTNWSEAFTACTSNLEEANHVSLPEEGVIICSLPEENDSSTKMQERQSTHSGNDSLSANATPAQHDSGPLDSTDLGDDRPADGAEEDADSPSDLNSTVLDQEGNMDTDGTKLAGESLSAQSNVYAPSPRSECASLREELMAIKLELASARTENEHYRRVLKETEDELDGYKTKCMKYENQGFKKLISPFAKKK